jgi:hypothetical protein
MKKIIRLKVNGREHEVAFIESMLRAMPATEEAGGEVADE